MDNNKVRGTWGLGSGCTLIVAETDADGCAVVLDDDGAYYVTSTFIPDPPKPDTVLVEVPRELAEQWAEEAYRSTPWPNSNVTRLYANAKAALDKEANNG